MVKKKSTLINESISNEMQVVKVDVPRGFPTGGTLKTEVTKADTDIKSIIL